MRKEGNVLFNDALNTFYLRLYGIRHMVKDHSDSERGNPLPPHGLLFPISSKGSEVRMQSTWFVIWYSSVIEIAIISFWFMVHRHISIICFKILSTRKEGNVLFNDALNTFYLRLYGIRHMVMAGHIVNKWNMVDMYIF